MQAILHGITLLKEKLILIWQTDEQVAKVISDFNPDLLGISILFQNLIQNNKFPNAYLLP